MIQYFPIILTQLSTSKITINKYFYVTKAIESPLQIQNYERDGSILLF